MLIAWFFLICETIYPVNKLKHIQLDHSFYNLEVVHHIGCHFDTVWYLDYFSKVLIHVFNAVFLLILLFIFGGNKEHIFNVNKATIVPEILLVDIVFVILA